jgi:hypothetical protein
MRTWSCKTLYSQTKRGEVVTGHRLLFYSITTIIINETLPAGVPGSWCRPYSRTVVGRSWNVQAYFARHVGRHRRAKAKCISLLRCASFLALQEAHSTDGRVRAASVPNHIRPFWSHGPTTIGGVSLWIDRDFLNEFVAVREEGWCEVEPGRAAVLRLGGQKGALDIFSIYMPTDAARDERARITQRLATAIRPRD